MPEQLGPHLLGRKFVADDRDWDLPKLHAHLSSQPMPPDSIADKTVRQLVTETDYLSTWQGILAFWRWIKAFFFHPAPSPTPPAPIPPAAHPSWKPGPVLDQGDYGTCVGNGWAGWGDATPVVDLYTEKDARAIYYEATCIDGACDDPDAPGGGQEGSTVRSGAKAMQKRGRLSAYAFAASLAQIDEWIDNHGPVVVGTDWTKDMFSPDSKGYVRPSGIVEGGHCYLLIDKVEEEDAYLFRNSWGSAWGLGGNFKMKASDFATLMASQGEACCAAETP